MCHTGPSIPEDPCGSTGTGGNHPGTRQSALLSKGLRVYGAQILAEQHWRPSARRIRPCTDEDPLHKRSPSLGELATLHKDADLVYIGIILGITEKKMETTGIIEVL